MPFPPQFSKNKSAIVAIYATLTCCLSKEHVKMQVGYFPKVFAYHFVVLSYHWHVFFFLFLLLEFSELQH